MKQFSIFLKGTLILTIAGLLSRFLGFFYKIFLAQALGCLLYTSDAADE